MEALGYIFSSLNITVGEGMNPKGGILSLPLKNITMSSNVKCSGSASTIQSKKR